MSKKTPPCPVYPSWTTARFFSFIRSALRKTYNKWPPKYEVIKKARRPVKGRGRQKWEYCCELCGSYFPQKEVEVDHKVAVGSLRSFKDLPDFTEKLFCSVDGLRVVCKECHAEVTAEQRKKQ